MRRTPSRVSIQPADSLNFVANKRSYLTAMDFAHKTTFELAGREFPRVTWWKNPGMRKTYICLMFVVLTSVCPFEHLNITLDSC